MMTTEEAVAYHRALAQQTRASVWNGYPPYTLRIENQGPRQEAEGMRGLYEVFVVDPALGDDHSEQVNCVMVVATSEANARVKALRDHDSEYDPDDLDILVRRVGDVRPKATAE